ncbi:hypothetical protein [Cellulomonas sp. KH9]|nr:hypothetical protein [Cellulomonas sp. KH9]SFK05124.1 hypothetical protein SAMN05216467_1901 [Cellulomonas sp. KH9]
MKPLTSALAVLAIAGSLVVGVPAATASVSIYGGASGCCKAL